MSGIVKIVGDRIRVLRQDRGLSQEQLAFKSSLNTSFLGQVERGEKTPSIETIEKIIVALDTTFEGFFSFENGSNADKHSSVIDKIAYQLSHRTIEEQEAVYSFIKQLLQFKDKM